MASDDSAFPEIHFNGTLRPSQKEVVDAVKLQLEETMKSERTKGKQRIQYFEVEDDEEED